VFVQQDGVVHVHVLGDDAHILDDVGLGVGHDHVLAAQHIGGAHQHRQADLVGGSQGLVQGVDGAAGGAGDAAALQQLVKALPVLGLVDGIGGGAQDGQADLVHMLGQLDGGLAAELDHAAVRLFGGDDVVRAFRGQGVGVEAVGGGQGGGEGLGVGGDRVGL